MIEKSEAVWLAISIVIYFMALNTAILFEKRKPSHFTFMIVNILTAIEVAIIAILLTN